MTDPATPPSRRPTPRWVWLLLVLSLGANLAVAGYAGGQFIRQLASDGMRGWERRIVTALPEARRAEAKAILSRDRGSADATEALAMLRQAMDDAVHALEAEPFEKDALTAAMQKRREAIAGRFAARSDRFIELAAMLTAEERSAVAEAMTAQSERLLRRMERRFGRRTE